MEENINVNELLEKYRENLKSIASIRKEVDFENIADGIKKMDDAISQNSVKQNKITLRKERLEEQLEEFRNVDLNNYEKPLSENMIKEREKEFTDKMHECDQEYEEIEKDLGLKIAFKMRLQQNEAGLKMVGNMKNINAVKNEISSIDKNNNQINLKFEKDCNRIQEEISSKKVLLEELNEKKRALLLAPSWDQVANDELEQKIEEVNLDIEKLNEKRNNIEIEKNTAIENNANKKEELNIFLNNLLLIFNGKDITDKNYIFGKNQKSENEKNELENDELVSDEEKIAVDVPNEESENLEVESNEENEIDNNEEKNEDEVLNTEENVSERNDSNSYDKDVKQEKRQNAYSDNSYYNNTNRDTSNEKNDSNEEKSENTKAVSDAKLLALPPKEMIEHYLKLDDNEKDKFVYEHFEEFSDTLEKSKEAKVLDSKTKKALKKELLELHDFRVNKTLRYLDSYKISKLVSSLYSKNTEKLEKYTVIDEQTGDRKVKNEIFNSLYNTTNSNVISSKLKDMSKLDDNSKKFINDMLNDFYNMQNQENFDKNSEFSQEFKMYFENPIKFSLLKDKANSICHPIKYRLSKIFNKKRYINCDEISDVIKNKGEKEVSNKQPDIKEALHDFVNNDEIVHMNEKTEKVKDDDMVR